MKTLSKIENCLSKDQFRPVLNFALLTRENIIASDAHVLAVLQTKDYFSDDFVTALGDKRYLIPRAACKALAAKKVQNVWLKDDCLHVLNGSEQIFPLETEERIGAFPAWDRILPKMEDKLPTEQIGINPKLMVALQDAIGNEFPVRVTFFGPTRAMLVHSTDPETASYGAVMPVMVNE